MKEFITANGITYEGTNVSTGTGSIAFTTGEYNAAELEPFFRGVSEIKVSDTKLGEPYGNFPDLKFESITTNEDGSVTVAMRIKSEIERRLDALEESQRAQDEAISGLAQSARLA